MKENEVDVLEQYDLTVNSTRKVRGAILCDTSKGPFLLKEMTFSEKRLPILHELYMRLDHTDMIQKNKEEMFVSCAEDGTKYILKKWFLGRECDSTREGDILEAVQNLAHLHQKMRIHIEENIYQKERLTQEFKRHNQELKKVRSFVRNKKGKGRFELIFLQDFEEIYEWAECAASRLAELNYDRLLEERVQQSTIVHGDYNYHNILFLPDAVATTNFEHFYVGIQMMDFYYFLRKIMEKNKWNVHLGHKMMEQYNRIHPFEEEELELLAICVAYPEKFWKAANSYYRSNKAWISIKSVEKLELAIQQRKATELFLKELFSFRL